MDEAGCDLIMRRRVREEGLLPGAIWHIFHPGDTNKIRDLLIKVRELKENLTEYAVFLVCLAKYPYPYL